MKRMNLMLMMVMAAVAAPSVIAQQGSGSGSGSGSGQGRGSQAVTTVRELQARQGLGMAQPINVRLDIVINDQSASGQPVRKSISLLVADREAGRVRSTGTLTQQYVGPGMVTPDGKPIINVRPVGEVQLNVDAGVTLLADDKIRTHLTLEYTPGGSTPLPAESAVTHSPLNQTATVILQNGKPLIITQAADPLSDRKITVEVTATILR